MRHPSLSLATALVVVVGGMGAASAWPVAPAGRPEPAGASGRSLAAPAATLVCPDPQVDVESTTTLGVLAGLPVPEGVAPSGTAQTAGSLTVTSLNGTVRVRPGAPAGPVVYPVPAGTGPLVVLAAGAQAPGASAMMYTRTSGGDGRGLAAVGCSAPSADSWFLAPGTRVGQRPVLYLANPTGTPALADLELYGPAGPVTTSAATGITVAAHTRVAVPLDAVAPDRGALAVHVVVRAGRLAAALHDGEVDGLDPRGVDWVPPAAPPGRRQVVPGVPGGDGPRILRVIAPGPADAVVAVRVLDTDGSYAPADRESLSVPAGSVAELDVANLGPPGDSPHNVGLLLESDVPVVAAVLVRRGPDTGLGELAWSAATSPLTGPAVLAAAQGGPATRTEIFLAAPVGPATVHLTVRYPGAGGAERSIALPAGGFATVPLAPPGDTSTYQVVITPDGRGPVHAAAMISESGPRGPMVTVIPLISAPLTVHLPAVARDLTVEAP